jgi:hypothetical protein
VRSVEHHSFFFKKESYSQYCVRHCTTRCSDSDWISVSITEFTSSLGKLAVMRSLTVTVCIQNDPTAMWLLLEYYRQREQHVLGCCTTGIVNRMYWAAVPQAEGTACTGLLYHRQREQYVLGCCTTGRGNSMYWAAVPQG